VKRDPIGSVIAGLVLVLTLLWASATVGITDAPSQVSNIPVKGMVTMVDLGSKECVPCKMMAPIIVELEKEYKNRAAIIFVDVWKQKDQSSQFEIRVIPTQIFFDREGKEVYRHEGFLDKDSIVNMLRTLGVQG